MEDSVVAIPTSLLQDIRPGEAMALGELFNHQIPFLDLHILEGSALVYARLFERLGDYWAFTTFPASTDMVLCGIVHAKFESEFTVITNPEELRNLGVDTISPAIPSSPSPDSFAPEDSLTQLDNLLKAAQEKLDKIEIQEKDEKLKVKTYLEEVQDTLEALYPDRWQIQNHHITIHWPEIEIKNSRGTTHTIRDLFVRLTFENSNLEKLTYPPEGMRTTKTPGELSCGYNHSHLPSGTYTSYNTFCTGVGPFANAIIDAYNRITPDSFFQFMLLLDQYVRWESLEGGPYMRMSDIRDRSQSVESELVRFPSVSARYVKLTADHVLREIPHHWIDVYTDPQSKRNIYSIKTSRDVQTAMRNLIDRNRTNDGVPFNLDIDRYVSSQTRRGRRLDWITNSIVFKGQNVSFKVWGDSPGQQGRIINRHSPVEYNAIWKTINSALNVKGTLKT